MGSVKKETSSGWNPAVLMLPDRSHGTGPQVRERPGHLAATVSSLEAVKLTGMIVRLKDTIKKVKHKHTWFWNKRKSLSRKGGSGKAGEQVNAF